MKRNRRFALVLLALVALAGAGCGNRRDGYDYGGGTDPGSSSAVSVKSGVVATDSWGYTASTPVPVAAPAQAVITLASRSLLVDGSRTALSGELPSTVSFSVDPTTLPTAAQSSVPSGFVCYLDLSVATAQTAIPAASVTVDVGSALAGTTVTASRYDAGSRTWLAGPSAVVGASGTASFALADLAVWGIFKAGTS
ncbi:hypothetical protein [Geomesophilobacter sediminis]|uniref:Lipoprotein n=1 Tax=Geomesophilobacter sediminis TaxID=2798584 RepID=A0A8J7LVF8_9BACT|nr:hypothetical protein [Geomesophilobacter sediminis]MBJ6725504.1 hypothetical protein [Geomesophilobacter sediminis]